jgi:hypothetical protein
MKEEIMKLLNEYWESPEIRTEDVFDKILTQFHLFLEFYKMDKNYDYKNNEEDRKSVDLINNIIQKIFDEKYKKDK